MENLTKNNLQVLSAKEAIEINAGESAWYWVAYGAGMVVRGVEAFMDGAHYASTTMPGLK